MKIHDSQNLPKAQNEFSPFFGLKSTEIHKKSHVNIMRLHSSQIDHSFYDDFLDKLKSENENSMKDSRKRNKIVKKFQGFSEKSQESHFNHEIETTAEPINKKIKKLKVLGSGELKDTLLPPIKINLRNVVSPDKTKSIQTKISKIGKIPISKVNSSKNLNKVKCECLQSIKKNIPSEDGIKMEDSYFKLHDQKSKSKSIKKLRLLDLNNSSKLNLVSFEEDIRKSKSNQPSCFSGLFCFN